jgi:hypothetical protein
MLHDDGDTDGASVPDRVELSETSLGHALKTACICLTLFGAFALPACHPVFVPDQAPVYVPNRASWRDGFVVRSVNANTAIVQYNGSMGVPMADVEARLLFRCAELALEHGYQGFIVQESHTTASGAMYREDVETSHSSSTTQWGSLPLFTTAGQAVSHAQGESVTNRFVGFARIIMVCTSDSEPSATTYSAESTYQHLRPTMPSGDERTLYCGSTCGSPPSWCAVRPLSAGPVVLPPCHVVCRQHAEACVAGCAHGKPGDLQACTEACRTQHQECRTKCPAQQE